MGLLCRVGIFIRRKKAQVPQNTQCHDALIVWLGDALIDWLVDALIGWLVDALIGWLVGALIGWLVDFFREECCTLCRHSRNGRKKYRRHRSPAIRVRSRRRRRPSWKAAVKSACEFLIPRVEFGLLVFMKCFFASFSSARKTGTVFSSAWIPSWMSWRKSITSPRRKS